MSRGFRDPAGEPVTGFQVYTEDGRNFVLLKDYVYERRDGCIIPLPTGSESDGASTPPFLWPTLPPFGLYFKAAYLHDICYRTGKPKDFADETLLDAMDFLNVPEIEAKVIYEGVRIGGKLHTRKM